MVGNGSRALIELQARLEHLCKLGFQNEGVSATKTPTRSRAEEVERPVKALGRRLAGAIKQKGWNKSDLARRLDVTPSAVGQWERGETLMESFNLIMAAQVLGESLDTLVYGMKGTIEKRIAALPETLRESVTEQIRTALEQSERLAQRNPALFGDKYVGDNDPRLTEWSAKDKPIKRKVATKKKPGKGSH